MKEYAIRIIWFIAGFVIGGYVLRGMMRHALKSVIEKWEDEIKKRGVEEYINDEVDS